MDDRRKALEAIRRGVAAQVEQEYQPQIDTKLSKIIALEVRDIGSVESHLAGFSSFRKIGGVLRQAQVARFRRIDEPIVWNLCHHINAQCHKKNKK